MNYSTISEYHPVIEIPSSAPVLDLSQGYDKTFSKYEYAIGRYNEKRYNMYISPLFTKENRNIHMGIDFWSPVNTPVYAFSEGKIYSIKYNEGDGNYGYTIITEHIIKGQKIYALYGHLGSESIRRKQSNQIINSGEILGWVGDYHENGGWSPHLHFQLSLIEPVNSDLPGVVNNLQHKQALINYPDPRIVLGLIYRDWVTI